MLITKPQYAYALNLFKNIGESGLHSIPEDFKTASTDISDALNDDAKFVQFIKIRLPEIQKMFRKVNLDISCLLHFVDYDLVEKGEVFDKNQYKTILQKKLTRSSVMERHLVNALAYKYKSLKLQSSNEDYVESLRDYLRFGVGYSVSEHTNKNKIPCILKTAISDAFVAAKSLSDSVYELMAQAGDPVDFVLKGLKSGLIFKIANIVENLEFTFAMQNVIENKNSTFVDFIDVIQNILKVPASKVLMVQLNESEADKPQNFSMGYTIVDFLPADQMPLIFKSIYNGDLQFMSGISHHALNFYYPDIDKNVLNLSDDEIKINIFKSIKDSNVLTNLEAFISTVFNEFDYIYFVKGNVLIKRNEELEAQLIKAEMVNIDMDNEIAFALAGQVSKPN